MTEIRIGNIIGSIRYFINKYGEKIIYIVFPMSFTFILLTYLMFIDEIKINSELVELITLIILIIGFVEWVIVIIIVIVAILSCIYDAIIDFYHKYIKNIVLFRTKEKPKKDVLIIQQIKDEFNIEI